MSPASDIQELKVAAPSKPEEQEPEGIPVEELEAKMLSVQKALERFDAVKVWPLSARYTLDLAVSTWCVWALMLTFVLRQQLPGAHIVHLLDAVCLDIGTIYRYGVYQRSGATFPSECWYFEPVSTPFALPWRYHTPRSRLFFRVALKKHRHQTRCWRRWA